MTDTDMEKARDVVRRFFPDIGSIPRRAALVNAVYAALKQAREEERAMFASANVAAIRNRGGE